MAETTTPTNYRGIDTNRWAPIGAFDYSFAHLQTRIMIWLLAENGHPILIDNDPRFSRANRFAYCERRQQADATSAGDVLNLPTREELRLPAESAGGRAHPVVMSLLRRMHAAGFAPLGVDAEGERDVTPTYRKMANVLFGQDEGVLSFLSPNGDSAKVLVILMNEEDCVSDWGPVRDEALAQVMQGLNDELDGAL